LISRHNLLIGIPVRLVGHHQAFVDSLNSRSTGHASLASPAATAGVVLSVMWPTEIVPRHEQSKHERVILPLLRERIRQPRKSSVLATAALEAIKKAHRSQKINEGTFRATFYKLASDGKKKTVRRRKPGRLLPGHGSADHIMTVGLHFIRLAGGVEEARERLVGLAELIETAREVD
jgi:hypothetical protein